MKDITILGNIEKPVNKMNYKKAFIEITTNEAIYTLNLNKKTQIGFRADNEKEN